MFAISSTLRDRGSLLFLLGERREEPRRPGSLRYIPWGFHSYAYMADTWRVGAYEDCIDFRQGKTTWAHNLPKEN